MFLFSAPIGSAQDWTQLAPSGNLPPVRIDPGGFYDAGANRFVLFGGANSTCGIGTTVMNDVWRLSNANGLGGTPAWSQASTSGGPPAARRAASVAYNLSSNRMIVFGGDKQPCGNATQKLNDVWVLTNANGNAGTATWSQLTPTGGPPPPRSDNAYVYDPASNRLTIFAGFSGAASLSDVWTLTNADGTGGAPVWTQLTPGGAAPPAVNTLTGVYDQSSNRMIIFGGVVCCSATPPIFNDTWVLTNANGLGGTAQWIKLAPSGTLPPARAGSSAGYIPATNQMVIFAGATGNGFEPQLNDTWLLNNANGLGGTPRWQLLAESNSPLKRGGSTAQPATVFDASSARMMIFGGFTYTGSGNALNDTWVFAPGAPVTVTTNPPGLAVLVQAVAQTAPYTFLCPPGANQAIGVTSPQSGGNNQQYAFNNWSDSSVLLSRTIGCPVSPTTYTANFSLQDQITLATNPAGVGLTVNLDGSAVFTPASPFLSLGAHILGVTSPQTGNQGAGVQYLYSSWSDGLAQTHNIDAAASLGHTFTANFNTQYHLTTNVSPAGLGAITVTPDPVPSGGFFNSGTPINLRANVTNSNFQFVGWSGSQSSAANPLGFNLNAPSTVTANFGSNCLNSLTSTFAGIGAGAGSGSVGIASAPAASASCLYSIPASSLPGWVNITNLPLSNSNYSGNTLSNPAIGFSFAANTGTSPRTGSFTVLDGNGFSISTFTLNQAANCPGLALSPAIINFSALGGANSSSTFNIPPCSLSSWTASVSDPTWVHLTSSSGAGPTVSFSVDPNSSGFRSATITVNTSNPNSAKTITVNQDGVVCTFALGTTGAPSSTSISFLGASSGGSIIVSLLAGPSTCPWTAAVPGAKWIHLTGNTGGNGNGTQNYTVDANISSLSRTGAITIAGLTYTINQAAGSTKHYDCQLPADISGSQTAIRKEGETELVGDVVFKTCGDTAAGGVVGDIVVTYNTNITNRLTDASGQTDALLLLNEPASPVLKTNAFLGVVAGPNAIRFRSVPLAPTASGPFTNNWRVRNVRVDATQVATLSPNTPTQVTGSVAFIAPVPVSAANQNNQLVATTQPPALSFSPLTSSPGPFAGQTIMPLQFVEGWANAFRKKQSNIVPGPDISTESGYVNAGQLGNVGLADNGTRLLAIFNGVPQGVTVFAPLVQASGSNAQLVSADLNGAGVFPFVPGNALIGGVTYQKLTPDATGAITATWEVTDADPNAVQSLTFNVLIANPNGASLSGMTIAGNLAPNVPVGNPSATAPVPRFQATPQTPPSLSVLPTTHVGVTALSRRALEDPGKQESARRLAGAGDHDAPGEPVPPSANVQHNPSSGSGGGGGSGHGTDAPDVTTLMTVTSPGPFGAGLATPNYLANSCDVSNGGSCTCQDKSCLCVWPSISRGQITTFACHIYNTGRSSGGQYVYDVAVTSRTGNSNLLTGSSTTNVPVPYVLIRMPADGATVPGKVTFTGFALPANSDFAIVGNAPPQVIVDDGTPANTTYGDFVPECGNSFTEQPPGCPSAGFSYLWNSAAAGPGPHKVCVTATDSGSNTGAACVNVATISGHVTAAGAPLSGVTITLSGAQNVSTTTDASGNYSFAGLATGLDYTITSSRAGYVFTPTSQPVNSLSFDNAVNFSGISVADNQGPSVTISSPANGATVSQTTITVSGTATDSGLGNNGISSVTVNGVPANGGTANGAGTANWSALISLSLGSNTITVVAKDGSSNLNATTQQITITLNAGPPPTALKFVTVSPCRFADTRNANGPFGGPAVSGGTTRDFVIPNSPCGIPPTAAAYSINVTVVPRGQLGFLTVFPSGQPLPLASTLNSLDGRVKANAAIVPAGPGGAISVFAGDTTDVVLDINGYFVPTSGGSTLTFFPLTPCRIADTRSSPGSFGGPFIGGNQSRSFAIRSSSCSVPATAQAYSMNYTVVPHGKLGFLTTYPSGGSLPLASTLNAIGGQVTANAAIVPAGANGDITVFASDDTDVVLDINGFFAPSGGGGLSLYSVPPCRLLDTRNPPGSPPFSGAKNVNVANLCGAPVTAQAYVFNATVVPAGLLGYLTLWPQGQSQPLVSTLNAIDGAVSSNMAIVPTTNGSISDFASDAAHLILDITAYFAP